MTERITEFPENVMRQKWKKLYIQKRYIFVLLGHLGMLFLYAMRASMSITIVAMVNQTGLVVPENTSLDRISECPNFDNHNKTTIDDGHFKGEQYNWDTKAQANILGSYFYGNIASQLLGGILAEKFGAKYVFSGGILIIAVISLLTPVVSSLGYIPVIILRVIQGLFDGLILPAVNFAISRWSPINERSRVSTVIFTGIQIGNIISLPLSGFLCSVDVLGGWPSTFYILGGMSCVWFLFWCSFAYEKPSAHPSISKEELFYIEEGKDEKKKKMSVKLWKSIFTSIPMWALIITHFGVDFFFLLMLTELPTYLSTVLNYDLTSNGLLSALPFLAITAGGWFSSFIADYLRKTNKLSITFIRKLMNSIGMFIPALCLIGITYAGCQSGLIIAFLCIAMLFNGFVYSGFNVTHVDMCPELAGTLYAITNTIANISGVLGPISVGFFTATGATLANWNNVFYTCAAVYIVSGMIFAIFASAELQPWGIIKDVLDQEVKPDLKGLNELRVTDLQTKL